MVAAELDELPQLTKGLDTFGDHLEPEAVTELDDRLDDGRVLCFVAETGDEAAIDLQRADRHSSQVRHR